MTAAVCWSLSTRGVWRATTGEVGMFCQARLFLWLLSGVCIVVLRCHLWTEVWMKGGSQTDAWEKSVMVLCSCARKLWDHRLLGLLKLLISTRPRAFSSNWQSLYSEIAFFPQYFHLEVSTIKNHFPLWTYFSGFFMNFATSFTSNRLPLKLKN